MTEALQLKDLLETNSNGSDESWRVYEVMYEKKGCQLDRSVYTVLINSFAKLGKFGQAKILFKKMATDGIAPDVYAYSSMVNGLCKAGKLKAAHGLLIHMEKAGCTPNGCTFGPLFQLLCETQKFIDACNLLEYMKQRCCTPNNVILRMLAAAFSNNQELKTLADLEPRILTVVYKVHGQ